MINCYSFVPLLGEFGRPYLKGCFRFLLRARPRDPNIKDFENSTCIFGVLEKKISACILDLRPSEVCVEHVSSWIIVWYVDDVSVIRY